MIFIDSGFLYAYVNEKEFLHKEVKMKMKEILGGKFGAILISNYIIDESLTLARAKTKRCEVGKQILKLINLKINEKRIFNLIIIDSALLELIELKYEKYCEKGLSYTDCSILALMDEYQISYLASTASEFEGLATLI